MDTPSQVNRDVIRFLKATSFLGRLPDTVLDRLVTSGSQRRHEKGETIFRRGDAGDSALIVLSGLLRIANTTSDGREIGLNFLGSGDIVGEIALIDGQERTATVIAHEACDVFVLRRSDILDTLLEHPKALLELTEAICQKLRTATAMIEDGTHHMENRLARGLLRLAYQHGLHQSGIVRIPLALSQTELGNYVGLSRPNVSRQLAHLKSHGIVEQDGRYLKIIDAKALEKLVQSAD